MARILILEHDPAILAQASALLRARGHGLAGAEDASEVVLCNARHPDAPGLAAQRKALLLLLVAPGDEALCERLLAQGADGYIGLPLEEGSFVAEVEAFLPSPPPPSLQPTLLLVDDDPFMLVMLEEVVRGQGWRVSSAPSGAAALALLENETVAVVVSDQCMPGMSGAALLAEVRARQPACYRILLSGQQDDEEIGLALRRGDAERFYTKPWHAEALLAALREAFRLQRGRAAG